MSLLPSWCNVHWNYSLISIPTSGSILPGRPPSLCLVVVRLRMARWRQKISVEALLCWRLHYMNWITPAVPLVSIFGYLLGAVKCLHLLWGTVAVSSFAIFCNSTTLPVSSWYFQTCLILEVTWVNAQFILMDLRLRSLSCPCVNIFTSLDSRRIYEALQ